jgi:hypothetical protein
LVALVDNAARIRLEAYKRGIHVSVQVTHATLGAVTASFIGVVAPDEEGNKQQNGGAETDDDPEQKGREAKSIVGGSRGGCAGEKLAKAAKVVALAGAVVRVAPVDAARAMQAKAAVDDAGGDKLAITTATRVGAGAVVQTGPSVGAGETAAP